MVGIVAVSHSRSLAEAAVALAMEMVHGEAPQVAVAAGLDAATFGTDGIAVKEAIEAVDSVDGVVVIMDLGSAVLSTDLALDLLDPETSTRVSVSGAPFVEGLVAAVVQASTGATREEVVAEAEAGLAGKIAHLGQTSRAGEAEPELGRVDAVGIFRVANSHGLHARPAARLVSEIKRFDARATLRNVTTESGPVPADSLSRVATLGAVSGHEVEVAASGPQAGALIDSILALALRNFDESDPASPGEVRPRETGKAQPASPGIAVGPKVSLSAAPLSLDDVDSEDPKAEWRMLREALAAVRTEIARVRLRVAHSASESDAGIFDAHLMLLEDRDLLDSVRQAIDSGEPAAVAWNNAITGVAGELAAINDDYLNARAADVRGVGDQVLRFILGAASNSAEQAGVLVAEDLTPAETADLDPSRIHAIVTAYGSATSHSAILARSLEIPAVVGAGRWVLEIPEQSMMVVDGSTGTIVVDPSPESVAEYEAVLFLEKEHRREETKRAHGPAVTVDGVVVEVEANVASLAATDAAVRSGADGVGLLRTEFMFLGRKTAPTAAEQEMGYKEIAKTLGQRRLTIRTLDVGGDKPLSFAPTPEEANPFLGVRGIRLSLRNAAVLNDQLVAICRVADRNRVAVMFPMVSGLDEVLEARSALDKAAAEANVAADRIDMGVMIEVPSAALNSSVLAPHVDFFSIGTNDLTQYTLAVERGNEELSAIAEALDPAVLKLIEMVCLSGEAHDVRVAVCGEVAADPLAVPILVGLGVRELSVSPPAVPSVKDEVRRWSWVEMGEIASLALDCPTATAVRALVSEHRKGLAPMG